MCKYTVTWQERPTGIFHLGILDYVTNNTHKQKMAALRGWDLGCVTFEVSKVSSLKHFWRRPSPDRSSLFEAKCVNACGGGEVWVPGILLL